MRKTLLSLLLLFAVATVWAQDAGTSWSVGSAANDKANVTWVGFAVPTVNDAGETVTEVTLKNIHLCTNVNGSGEKTAYMVISSTKDILGKVGVSTNNPAPQNNALIEYKFENLKLNAGNTYYMFFSESNTEIASCGQRIAISDANGNYEPKVGAGGAEKTWIPYFKVNVVDPLAVPAVFSTTYGEKWLRLTNCNNSNYAWSAPSAEKAGTDVLDMSLENQLFCFVGNNTDGFTIYSKVLGADYKLTASTSPGNGTVASWTTGDAAKWYLNMSQNAASDKPGIGITTNVSGGNSLNMYGGNGGDLKFYAITDGGSRWTISRINPEPLNVLIKVQGETKYPENNSRIGDFKLSYGTTTSTTTITKDTDGTAKKMYLPFGQKVSMSTFTYHGWNATIEEGEQTVVTFSGDMKSEYQYLWYHNNPPYRIPAIATRKDGKILALCDYRPCGGDIGNGRVDLVQRIGSADGSSWGASNTIIEGNVSDTWNGNDGFGDPAVCIDRETGRVLLICVTGRTVCGNATRSNPNRIARFYSENGGETYHSVVEGRDSIYDDITEEIYSLWDTEAYKAGDKTSTDQYTAQSFFVGSGRIFQSSKIKIGEYYRIYAALWSKDMHNRVAYSDDFGLTWHILGTREDMPFPNFGNANEPKCEELPNGDVIMSSRKPHGRYYNIFTYSDIENGQGSWGVGTNSDIPAPSDWNGTNGEITTYLVEDPEGELHNIALQSLPLGLEEYSGDVRRNVGFYFKDITSKYSYQKNGKNDVATFASGWEEGLLVSTTQGSAYSTFTLQDDGRIGFFYEETPGGYSMVYVPLTISEITGGKYVKIVGNAKDFESTPVNITYTYKYGDVEWYKTNEVAYVGEQFPSAMSVAYVQTDNIPSGVVALSDEGKNFDIECELSEEYPFIPSASFDAATWYSLKIRDTKNISYNPHTGKFVCNTSAVSGERALFAFVGNPIVGYKIQNRLAGADKAIGGAVTNNGHVTAVDFDNAPKFVLENNSGHLVFRNVENSLGYLNDVQSTLGYWVNSGASTDGGSTLIFTEEALRDFETAFDVFPTLTGGDIPYRIPAITTAKNGNIIAVADYRHSRADIGMATNGRIDLRARISEDNGKTWGDIFDIVQGKGAEGIDASNNDMYVGFGDPCIVADRESDRILVISCSGNVSFPNGQRNNHQGIAHFYSTDGKNWSAPVDRSESIYAQFDDTQYGPVRAMFVGSGKISQSKYIKVNDYYRIYCAVLVKDKNGTHINFVLFSDDFGEKWTVLGGGEISPIPGGGDEPKAEELPDGSVIISSRTSGGRIYNIFSYTDSEKAEGSWGTSKYSNASNNGTIAVSNSTNGEIMCVPVKRKADDKKMFLALQSVPLGSGRANVGIYYKELETLADFVSPEAIAADWDGCHQASCMGGAYSTMTLQKDNNVGFLYEEETYCGSGGGGYTIVYKNYSIEYLTDSAYVYDATVNHEDVVVAGVDLKTEGLEGGSYVGCAPQQAIDELGGYVDAYKANPSYETYEAINAAIANLPTLEVGAGKWYRIRNAERSNATLYLKPEASRVSAATSKTTDADQLFTFIPTSNDKEYYLYNGNYQYMLGPLGNNETQPIVTTDTSAAGKWKISSTVDGLSSIICQNKTGGNTGLHLSGDNVRLVPWTNTDDASLWYIEPVDEITLTINEYLAVCMPFAMTLPEGVTAYVAADVAQDANGVAYVPVVGYGSQIVAEAVPVILAAANGEYVIGVGGSPEAKEIDNALKGVLKSVSVSGSNVFTLNAGEFVKRSSTSGNITANTAYYVVETSEATLPLRAVETSIDSVKAEQDVKFYDLKGNLVEKPLRGIYITSEGKKVFVL